MAVVLILGYLTVVVLLSNAHSIGLIGSLGGLGADLNIGLGSRQSSASNNYGYYKHGDIGADFRAGIGGSSALNIASASSLSPDSGFGGDGSGAIVGFAGGGTASSAFGHSNSRAESSGLGLELGLDINSGAQSNGNGRGNTLGHHKGGPGLLDVGFGIVGSTESSSSAAASAANNIRSQSDHFAGGSLSSGASSTAGGSSGAVTSGGGKGGSSAGGSISGLSNADLAGSLALNIDGSHSVSASGVEEEAISSNRKNEASSSLHISSSGGASHKLVGNNHGHGSSTLSGSSQSTEIGLLRVIASDSDRKREHAFRHSSSGSTTLEGRLNPGSAIAGSSTQTLLSSEKGSRGSLDKSSSGVRSTIRVGGNKNGHRSSFSTSHSAAHLQHASSSDSLASSVSEVAGSHDSGLVVGFEGYLSGSSHLLNPTISNEGYKNTHGHSIGIGGSLAAGSMSLVKAGVSGNLGSDGSSSSSGLKVAKHETDHNSNAGLSGSTEVSAKVDSSKTVSSSKVISGSYGSSSIQGSAAASSELKGINSVGHSALSKESLGAAHSQHAAAKIGVGTGLGLLGSKSIELIASPGLQGSLSLSSGGSTATASDTADVGLVKGSSPTILSSASSADSSGTLAAGSFNVKKQIGFGVGLGLSSTSSGIILDSPSSLGSKSEISKASIDTKVHDAHSSDSQITSSASAGTSSVITDSISGGFGANANDDNGSAVVHSTGFLGSSSSIASNTRLAGDGVINSSPKEGGYGTTLSTIYSKASGGVHNSGSSGILSHINGLIGGIHKSITVSTEGYGGTSSINTSHDRNIVSKNSAESLGVLGGLLGAHASVGSYSSSGANSQPLAGSTGSYKGSATSSLEGYSPGHKGNYKGNLNTGASASASSSSSYGSISGGLGLVLGR